MPVSSLPSKYGIGTFGREAYKFVDFLQRAGQCCWQILPLVPTGFGDSPYQSFSTFAGNPYFIDLELLIKRRLLTRDECGAADLGDDPLRVDYEKQHKERDRLLRLAYSRRKSGMAENIGRFRRENAHWLDDFALFMAVKGANKGAPWQEWDEDIRLRRPRAMEEYKNKYADEIDYTCFVQYLFFKQWGDLRAYANARGIKIIGDIPIYVAADSADVWAAPDMFLLDENLKPTEVAGCPPDAYSATGQLWGNPLYNWAAHRADNYRWWTERMRAAFKLYDTVRIDHFRAFAEYFAIPACDSTAEGGRWRRGPGIDLFNVMKAVLGPLDIIAEDLGYITKSVVSLLDDAGFAGMKVLQFAFDPWRESIYIPHNYKENSVVYTSTHDSDTTVGWYRTAPEHERAFAEEYLGVKGEKRVLDMLIRTAFMSNSRLCVISIQDWLGMDSSGRINIPSTTGGNWTWRLGGGRLTKALERRMRRMAVISLRDRDKQRRAEGYPDAPFCCD